MDDALIWATATLIIAGLFIWLIVGYHFRECCQRHGCDYYWCRCFGEGECRFEIDQ